MSTRTGSNRRGETADTHQTRSRAHTLPVYFTCDLCLPGTPTHPVRRTQSVIDAQAQHRMTHDLALREQVEAVVAGHADGSITVTPRRPVVDDSVKVKRYGRW